MKITIKFVLWYGYAFYIVFLFFFYLFFITFFKFLFSFSLIKSTIYNYFSILFLSFLIFLNFIFLFFLYFLFEFFSSFNLILSINNFSIFYFNFIYFNNFFNFFIFNLNLTTIYIFPFIYIFLLITTLSILYCLSYNKNELISFFFYTFIILINGSLFFLTDSFILFFLFYEFLLIPSFFILYKFAKTRKCVEASFLMFFWTQFGALFLIFSFIYLFFITHSSSFSTINLFSFSSFEVNFFFLCWIIGFGVKLPIWPFYNWLPKAHVEASTNFSIFLSGVLVKFAFFGLMKCLFVISLEPTFYYIYPFLTIGIIDSVFKLFYQLDLKKLIAYSTVVEMHWLTFCILSGNNGLFLSAFCMLISHALLSTNSFLLMDAVNRRFKTRLINEISGLNFLCPKLFLLILVNCLIFLGFPGSIFFIAEFLFFSFFFDLFPLLTFFLITFLYFFAPTFFFKNWTNVMFGLSFFSQKTLPLDLNSKELIIYGGNIVLMFWLGISWQCFIF